MQSWGLILEYPEIIEKETLCSTDMLALEEMH